ncbi:MAG: M14 family metallopeptidase [Fulvivirga sp.]|nr:M14 family metallopeptidase [Fulvivirga sp.]
MNKTLITVFCFLFIQVLPAQENLKTVFELSDGKQTATYKQTIRYYRNLEVASSKIKVVAYDATDSGEPLHLVMLDWSETFDLKKSRESGKTHVLINNGIHPGEPDGIEASKMLLRDLLANAEYHNMLEDIIIAVIPVYNIGGALNRNEYSRANQNGPEAYGFRGNARNYDLNRDFIKADTRNTRSFYKIFHDINPDIFIDTHVSNGADYQYTITHLATQHNKLGKDFGVYLEEEFTPALEIKMKEKGSEIIPYVNVFNRTPDAEGYSQFMDRPRYSTGYTTLFHTLGFMIETHMLKPFDVRVQSTYNFLMTMIELAEKEGHKIQTLRKERESFFIAGNVHPIAWQLNRDEKKALNFKGYEGKMVPSKITGQERLQYDRSEPFTKSITYYNVFQPDKEIEIPTAYIVPQGWHEVIERLTLNGADFERFEQDTTLSVEAYHIASYNTSREAYEGHYPHRDTKVDKDKRLVDFREGDYVFHVDQFAGRYLVETMEPEAPDSFFNWNFFDTILQQKEHFSPYVFEDVAWELLDEDSELKEAFERRKDEDKGFANNWYAQLDFIYRNSKYYEKAHLQYPVYRLVD